MGRWGHRLFEGDTDFDVAHELDNAIEGVDLKLSPMIHQADLLSGGGPCGSSSGPDHQLTQFVAQTRHKLDGGLGAKLMDYCRARESEIDMFDSSKYRTIIAGALIMRAGAEIRPQDMQHLRDLVPQITCNFGYTFALWDQGFRHAGKVQYLAALDHYTPGIPRDYEEPSCFACGKVQSDTGFAIKKCHGCGWAWYCSKAG